MFERLTKPNQHKALLRIPIYFLPLLLLFSMLMPSSALAQASVCGYVFFDANQNGVKDDGELTRANHIVYLDDFTLMFAGKGGSFSTVTDADGKFCFTAQSVGGYGYYLRTEIPEGMQSLTTPQQFDLKTGVVPPHAFQVSSSSQQVEVNFGFYGAVSDAEPIWSQCQTDEEKDNSVCIHNQDYAMQVTPDKEEKQPSDMQVEQFSDAEYGDFYVGDNTTSQVFVGERGDNTRSTRNQENSEQFFITVGKNISDSGEEESLEAFINPDDSVSFIDPDMPSLTATLHQDGSYTAIDSNTPEVTVAIDKSGNLTATDSQQPTMAMFIEALTGAVLITDTDYPSTTATINADGSYTVTDTAFPHLIATIYADGEYVVEDTSENMTVHIDSLGNYTVIDNNSNTCVVIPKTRLSLGGIFKGIKKAFRSITKFINKIAGFVGRIAKFVVRVAPIVSKVFRVVAVVAKIAAIAFPPLCPFFCAVAGFATAVANISDAVGLFANKVAMIADGIQQGNLLTGMWTGNYSYCGSTRRKIRNDDHIGYEEPPVILHGEVYRGYEEPPVTLHGEVYRASMAVGEYLKGLVCKPDKTTSSDLSQNIYVNIIGDGQGQVISSPAGINCYSSSHNGCSVENVTSNIILTAQATGSSKFTGWEGECAGNSDTCTLHADNNTKQVTAKFFNEHEIELQVTGSSGIVRSSQIKKGANNKNNGSCSSRETCPVVFTEKLSLTAVGDNFIGWEGLCSSLNKTCTVTYHEGQPKTIKAKFETVPILPLENNEIRGYQYGSYLPNTNLFGMVRWDSNGSQKQPNKKHYGWDLVAPIGTEIYAIADGKIAYTIPDNSNTNETCSGYGTCIAISFDNDGDGIDDHTAFYSHLSRIGTINNEVKKGQIIGYTGDTDATFLNKYPREYHLHFEIRNQANSKWKGHAINPSSFYGFTPKNEPK